MRHTRLVAFCWILPALVATRAALPASLPFVSPIFGDNMVLQRGKTNTIWGWAKPGQEVRVEFGGQSVKAVAGPDGRWQAPFLPPAPGGPYILRCDGPQTAAFRNVLVGDLWLCGGQSNMEFPLARARNGAEEIKAANHPEIRCFKVAAQPAYSAAAVPQGRWKVCSPQSMSEEGGFSAVAYFFARRVREDVNVPIGLIQDAVGGTPAEAWTSPQTLRSLKEFDAQLNELERLKTKGGPEYGNFVMHWYDDHDLGQKGRTWAAAALDDSGWEPVALPGGFRELGVAETPSVCWFRKELTLPDPLPAGRALLRLGVIEKMDTAYINGQWVGASAWVENPRAYPVKDGVLQPGRNLVTLRIFKLTPQGGFMSKAEALRLTLGDGTVIPLAGAWKGKVSVDARPPHPLPLGFENWPVIPSVLHQGMLQPLAPLAITGAIWYQGEANADRPRQYQALLPALIGDWRRLFGQGDFPFYIVSLPAFSHRQDRPGESTWAELRAAQALTACTIANCGLAVTIDRGDPDDIHPPDKKIVGERLALCALAKHYGKAIVCEGPTFKSVERLPGGLKLHFDHAAGGLVCQGDKLEEFSVAGKDRQWHWADARIHNDTVIVSSPQVPEPEVARYAWQSFPKATLYNGAGLPAVPFRTDR